MIHSFIFYLFSLCRAAQQLQSSGINQFFLCPLKSILTPRWKVTAQGKVKFEMHSLIQVTSCWMYKFMSQEGRRSFFLTDCFSKVSEELNKTSPHHKPIACLFKKQTNKQTQAAAMNTNDLRQNFGPILSFSHPSDG